MAAFSTVALTMKPMRTVVGETRHCCWEGTTRAATSPHTSHSLRVARHSSYSSSLRPTCATVAATRPSAPGRGGRGRLLVANVATAIHRNSLPEVSKLLSRLDFERAVNSVDSGLVVVTVGTQTCHSCEILNQKLAEELCFEFLNVKFYRLNGDETSDNYKMVKAWGTHELPEVRVYYEGELLEKMVTTDVERIHQGLENYLCEKLELCNSADVDFDLSR